MAYAHVQSVRRRLGGYMSRNEQHRRGYPLLLLARTATFSQKIMQDHVQSDHVFADLNLLVGLRPRLHAVSGCGPTAVRLLLRQCSLHIFGINSGHGKATRINRKNRKRQQGMRPPPKREHGLGSLVPDINPNIIPNNLVPINQHNQHSSRSSKLVCLLERHNGETMQPPRPPKRARTEGTNCKGNCPSVWNIVQYQTSTIFYSKVNLESVASQW